MPKDLRTPIAKARDYWLESKEGQKCRFGVAEGQYLENRLAAAFVAGWNAKELSAQKRKIGAIESSRDRIR
jgi:hypothetical protein